MRIVTVGIDLAKNVFAMYGVDDNGKPVLVKPKVAHADLAALIAQLPPCLIGMGDCSGEHRWARLSTVHSQNSFVSRKISTQITVERSDLYFESRTNFLKTVLTIH